LHNARSELAFVVGDPSAKERECEGVLADASPADSISPQGDHPSVKQADLAVAQHSADLERARLQGYPDVTVGIEGGREGRDDTGLLQFRVSVPLPIFSRPRARVREAEARLQGAQAAAELARKTLARDLDQAREKYRGASAQARAYAERIIPKSEDALRLARLGYQEGRFGLFDLLDTQRTAAETRLQYQKLLLDVALARNQWEALTQAQTVEPENK